MKRNNTIGFKAAWMALFTVVFVMIAPGNLLAHARLIRSTPGADKDMSQSPAEIELWFNELLDQGFNTITVYSSTEQASQPHNNLVQGDPQVDPKDQTHLTIALKSLPPGEYLVEWRVLSADGHSAPGKFKFRVGMAK